MGKENPPRPADAELAILQALGELGPSTVRQVCASVSRDRPSGYTTILKLLQIMTEKGPVKRDTTHRTHVYQARFSQEETQQQLVGDLTQRAFGGSALKLVMRALSAQKTSPEELEQLRALIDELERETP